MATTKPMLTEPDRSALGYVCAMPLISAGELADLQGTVFSTAARRLARLADGNFIEGALMGASCPEAKRYRLTPKGSDCFYEHEVYFHLPRQINTLACRLPAVEWFYHLAATPTDKSALGRLRSFHWRAHDGADALAQYDRGKVAFMWSGPWQNRKTLDARLEALGNSGPMIGGWPDLLCVVASDDWQARLAEAALVDFGIQNEMRLVSAETRTMWIANSFTGSEAQLSLRPLLSPLGNNVSPELPRMMRGALVGPGASLLYRILHAVEQFHGAKVAAISRALGSHPRNIAPKVDLLVDAEMLVQVDGHLYLADAALTIAAHRDRVHVSRLRRRFGLRDDGLPSVARHRSHDGAATAIVSVFKSLGFPVAGGWRGDDYSGGRDAIAPDAMIYMGDGSSGGAGWRYMEYEKRGASEAGVAAKLRGFIARPGMGLMLAARNESMAAEFRRQAAAAGLPIWVASIPSIRVTDPQNVAGAKTVWLDASGQAAVFKPPK